MSLCLHMPIQWLRPSAPRHSARWQTPHRAGLYFRRWSCFYLAAWQFQVLLDRHFADGRTRSNRCGSWGADFQVRVFWNLSRVHCCNPTYRGLALFSGAPQLNDLTLPRLYGRRHSKPQNWRCNHCQLWLARILAALFAVRRAGVRVLKGQIARRRPTAWPHPVRQTPLLQCHAPVSWGSWRRVCCPQKQQARRQ